MHFSRPIKLTLGALVVVTTSAVCSSGYITPKSLAATQDAAAALTATVEAFVPSATLTDIPPTPTPSQTPLAFPTATQETTAPLPPYLYTAQSGDTLAALAVRFGVNVEDIASPQDIPDGLINAGQIFTIPNVLSATSPSEHLLPDSEIIYSPSAIGFDTENYATTFEGYLSRYREYLPMEWHNGGQVVEKVAIENSINPQLLLSVLQFQSDWVLGEPNTGTDLYPIGYRNPQDQRLYHQLTWAAKQLSIGYYEWREGRRTDIVFRDGTRLRIAPDLNAGSVAIQYLFAQLYNYDDWLNVIDKSSGFPFTHSSMFPDPWVRAAQTEPLFPPELSQPALSLPFFANQIWYFTSGPHGGWEREGSRSALDFAPSSTLPGCTSSEHWVTAAAPGLIVRSTTGVIVVDMDGDGNEQTGWVILYLHVDHPDIAKLGDWVDRGDKLGHPSCEGGVANGTHLHIARKYNGEWISAGGPVPFELSGWVTSYGTQVYTGLPPYPGELTRDGLTVTACTCSGIPSQIAHNSNDPY